MKKRCSEFEDSFYDKKTKRLMVCVDSKGKYVTHTKYKSMLLKELRKDLSDDIKYIPKNDRPRLKTFSNNYKNKYVKHYTILKKRKISLNHLPRENCHV